MTQEDKKLLFKDLCARLPYGVIVKYKSREREGIVKLSCGNIEYVDTLGTGWWVECKPYLRPMSSMTAVELGEYISLKEDIIGCDNITYFFETCESIDWLNEHHFDYRGLIEKGLAIKVTKKNNPYK